LGIQGEPVTNRDYLVDGLHSVLSGLWDGSDEMAASEFRKLVSWRIRALKAIVPTYRAGTFPAPVLAEAEDHDFLESAGEGMLLIEKSFAAGDSEKTARLVKELLTALSERRSGLVSK
jgi:hypothetical protein